MVETEPRAEVDRGELAKIKSWPQFWAYTARNAALAAIVGALLYGIDKHLTARNADIQGHLSVLLDRCVPDQRI